MLPGVAADTGPAAVVVVVAGVIGSGCAVKFGRCRLALVAEALARA